MTDDASIYCRATKGKPPHELGCGNYITSESLLCGGHAAQLTALVAAVPELIASARLEQGAWGAQGGGDPVSGTKEKKTPANLMALDDADAMYALLVRYADQVGELLHLPVKQRAGHRAGWKLVSGDGWEEWTFRDEVTGLRHGQTLVAALECTRLITQSMHLVVQQDWTGFMADDFRLIVGPARSRWQTSEQERWMVCPKCDTYSMRRYAPSFEGGPITHTCVTAGCEANLTEDDFAIAVYSRNVQQQKEIPA